MKKLYFLSILFIGGNLLAQTYEYHFNNNLNEATSGPALVDTLSCGQSSSAGYSSQAVCTGGTKTVLDFNAGEGLVFENSTGFIGPTSSYTINMLMKFNSLVGTGNPTGSQRIINFDTASNFGVYSFQPGTAPPNGAITFYTGSLPTSNSFNTITAGSFFLMTIVRDATTDSVFAYINGHKADSAYDPPTRTFAPTGATAPIWFFIDNGTSASYPCENGPGSISYLSLTASAFTATQVDSTWGAQCPAVLPLHLLDFHANKQNNAVNLSWTTTREVNTSYFELERGADGKNFSGLATIATNNNTSVNTYNYIDQQPLSTNFYRLKMVDIDGNFKYSAVLKINFSGAQKFEVFPNPTNSVLTISGINNNELVKLLSIDGKLLLEKRASGQSMTMDLGNLSSGLYILQYFDGSNIQNRKIIKD
ncbi:MAG TPA: T9SS type A sorting domain-containing protein [Chitinophagaceae bacterium]|jgi:hypothetical protein|nr:T9SS type A sorting domain-containing protein [Chitinophagaceae bacterium]